MANEKEFLCYVILAYSLLKMNLSILKTSLIFLYFFQIFCLSSTSYSGNKMLVIRHFAFNSSY